MLRLLRHCNGGPFQSARNVLSIVFAFGLPPTMGHVVEGLWRLPSGKSVLNLPHRQHALDQYITVATGQTVESLHSWAPLQLDRLL